MKGKRFTDEQIAYAFLRARMGRRLQSRQTTRVPSCVRWFSALRHPFKVIRLGCHRCRISRPSIRTFQSDLSCRVTHWVSGARPLGSTR
jgi:hypothetical protein